MYLVFDTETTGFPKKGATYSDEGVKDVDKWPRIIQLAWARYSENGDLIKKECHLIKPDGWVVPDKDFWIRNGFATHINEQHGRPMQRVLIQFAEDIRNSECMIAHNIDFDHAVTCAEMIRYGVKAGKKLAKFCTMKSNVHLGSKGKGPSLEDLYAHLFRKLFSGAHDAGSDVQATAEIFFEQRRGFKKIDDSVMAQVNEDLMRPTAAPQIRMPDINIDIPSIDLSDF